MTSEILWVLFGLCTKHFILDFICQGPFQYLNKGEYGHPGGLLHSGLQALGTLLVFFVLGCPFFWAFMLGVLDGVIHYHIDWAKIKINKRFDLRPDNSEKFWWLLGLDQYLHYLTYLLLVLITVA